MEAYSELVGSVVREHFGDIVEAVCTTLLAKGTLTLPELKRFCPDLEKSRIQDALAVLIQHNLVVYENHLNAKTDATTVHYSLLKDNVVLRLRFPVFVRLAKDLFGANGERIAEQLTLRGRLSMNQIIENVTKATQASATDVRETFTEMVTDHFLVRVSPPKNITLHTDGTRKENTEEGFDQYSLPGAGAASRKRAHGGDEGRSSKKRVTEDGEVSLVGGADDDNLLADFADENDSALWRLNMDQIHVLLRNQDICKYVKERVDALGADIVRVILKLTELEPPVATKQLGRTGTVTLYQINKALRNASLGEQDLHYHLLMLCELSDGIVEKKDESQGGKYCINVSRAADLLRGKVLESIVKERLGSHCCRMYRMVAKQHNLEERQLAEMAMIEFKEARKLMNKMVVAGFLEIQEVPKTVNRIPSATFFLLSHNTVRCVDKLKVTLLSTLGKVMSRRRSTISRHTKFLDKVERQLGSRVANAKDRECLLLNTDVSSWEPELRNQLSEADQISISKLHNTVKKLTSALLLVDQSLMVLHDY